MFTDCVVVYSRTALSRKNWDGELSGLQFFFLIGNVGSLSFGSYRLKYEPGSNFSTTLDLKVEKP
jgi:hypothetical protein